MNFKIKEICCINKNNIRKNDTFEFINYLDTGNLIEGRIDTIQKLFIDKDKIPSRAKRKVKSNDILISTVRPNQKHYGILKEIHENMIVSTGFTVLSPNDKIVNPIYLYKYLTQISITEQLQIIAETSTTAYPSIKPSDIGDIEIELPPIDEQKVIAKILFDLDIKIEINNKISKNLEEIARNIFKHWFIDFEFPNKEGKPYKSSGGEMIDSKLGFIPKHWSITKFNDYIKISSGKKRNIKNKEKTSTMKVPVIGSSTIIGYTDEILLNRKVIIIGRVGTLGVIQRFNEGIWPSDNTLIISSEYYNYVYQILKQINFKNLNVGSTQPLITQTDIKNIDIIKPQDNVLNKFETIINKLFKKIDYISKENKKLSDIRDTLLPKLMSGEIKVPIDDK